MCSGAIGCPEWGWQAGVGEDSGTAVALTENEETIIVVRRAPVPALAECWVSRGS